MKFECDCCGICCKNIKHVPQLQKYDNGNGECIYLTEDNKCSIYNNRPEICNVDLMYQKKYSNFYSKDEFYKLNYEVCIQLKKNYKK